jgi:hypothetical protein
MLELGFPRPAGRIDRQVAWRGYPPAGRFHLLALPFRRGRSVHVVVPDDRELGAAIDVIAQRIQAMHLMAVELRRQAHRASERSVELESEIDECVRILKRLQNTEL